MLASVADVCLSTQRAEDFIFVHIVDSCPGSNLLEQMIRRLHVSLRQFCEENGERDIQMDCPESAAELKFQHRKLVEIG